MASQTDYQFGPWYDNYGGWPIISMQAAGSITKGQVVQLSTGTYARGVVAYDGDAGITTPAIGVALNDASAGEMVSVLGSGPVMMLISGAGGCTSGQAAVVSTAASEDGRVVSEAWADGTAMKAVLGTCLTTADTSGEYVAVLLHQFVVAI